MRQSAADLGAPASPRQAPGSRCTKRALLAEATGTRRQSFTRVREARLCSRAEVKWEMSVIVGLGTEAGAQGHRRPEVALAAKCNGLRQKKESPHGRQERQERQGQRAKAEESQTSESRKAERAQAAVPDPLSLGPARRQRRENIGVHLRYPRKRAANRQRGRMRQNAANRGAPASPRQAQSRRIAHARRARSNDRT